MEIDWQELRHHLEALVDRELDSETASRLEAHLRSCSWCWTVYEEAVSFRFACGH